MEKAQDNMGTSFYLKERGMCPFIFVSICDLKSYIFIKKLAIFNYSLLKIKPFKWALKLSNLCTQIE
jgi:hypothetical protein